MSSTIRSTSGRLLTALILVLVAVSCGGGDANPAAPSFNVPYSQSDLRVGTGTEATAGRRVTVNYTGWLYSATAPENKGEQFDSSLSAGRTPYAFTIGAGEVIRGWDQGVVGMRVGG
jgi:FKBP-type peptidyl-prolyl cis-trans isomerase FkpA